MVLSPAFAGSLLDAFVTDDVPIALRVNGADSDDDGRKSGRNPLLEDLIFAVEYASTGCACRSGASCLGNGQDSKQRPEGESAGCTGERATRESRQFRSAEMAPPVAAADSQAFRITAAGARDAPQR